MKNFEIGPGLTCDLERLVVTRLLVQANSGGGKSWLLRRILEQTAGKIQQLVIDPEGEFSTLREKFDYVLAAKSGGDTAADPRTAKLLAERLLELKVSAILDIYELDPHARILFVRRFLEALVDAPKTLWHPVLVVVDESHTFCPEVGQAESANAVKALATRGRKRGFCAVFATQRLSKFAKDAAAECNNKLIGRTSLDVDMARAGDELGFGKGDRLQLRDLSDGEFFAFGPALSKTVTRVVVGKVQTTHPEAGGRLALAAPPPPANVRALLPKLSDLPQEAADRERSIAELKTELANTKRELTIARKEHPAAKAETKTVEKFVLKDGQLRRAKGIVAAITHEVERHEAAVKDRLDLLRELTQEIAGAIRQTHTHATMTPRVDRHVPVSPRVHRAVPSATASRPVHAVSPSSNGNLAPARQKILDALAFFQGIGVSKVDKVQLSLMAGVPHTSGGYKNNLGALRTDGYIEYPTPGDVALTDVGRAVASADGVPQTTDELHEAIKAKLPPAKWKILDVLIGHYPNAMAKEELAERCGVPDTSGGYKNNLGSLRSLGLIGYPQPGTVAAQPMLFLDESELR